MKIDKIAHIYEDGMWGTSNADNSRKWFEENSPNTKIVFWEGYNRKPPIDLSSSVLKLKKANPDLLICSSYLADAIALLETMHELNCYIPNIVAIGGGFVDPKLIEEVGNLVKGVCVACLWSSDITTPKAVAFTEAYYKKYGLYPTGDTGAFAVNVEVLFNALEKAKSTDPEKIREALVNIDMEDSIAGYPVKFADNGDNIYASAFVTQITEIDGKLKWSTMYPSKLATSELEIPMLPYDKR
jgi:branched-chain amino acid transport system substrate-binding protein